MSYELLPIYYVGNITKLYVMVFNLSCDGVDNFVRDFLSRFASDREISSIIHGYEYAIDRKYPNSRSILRVFIPIPSLEDIEDTITRIGKYKCNDGTCMVKFTFKWDMDFPDISHYHLQVINKIIKTIREVANKYNGYIIYRTIHIKHREKRYIIKKDGKDITYKLKT